MIEAPASFVRYSDGSYTSGPVSEDMEMLVRIHIEERLKAGEKIAITEFSPAMRPVIDRLHKDYPWLLVPGLQ